MSKRTDTHRIIIKNAHPNPTKYKLNKAKTELKTEGLTDFHTRLLCGGNYQLSIVGRYGNPSMEERLEINRKGKCHSCGSRQACFIYHADHCPPRELGMTSWFPELMSRLGNPLDDTYFFRPQCPSCSHSQGQRCKKLVKKAGEIASEMGVTRYST